MKNLTQAVRGKIEGTNVNTTKQSKASPETVDVNKSEVVKEESVQETIESEVIKAEPVQETTEPEVVKAESLQETIKPEVVEAKPAQETIEPEVVKAESVPEPVQKPQQTENVEKQGLVRYNPIFDLNDPRVVRPKRNKKNSNVPMVTKTVYFLEEELEIVERCAEEHDMSLSKYLRTLAMNAK